MQRSCSTEREPLSNRNAWSKQREMYVRGVDIDAIDIHRQQTKTTAIAFHKRTEE